MDLYPIALVLYGLLTIFTLASLKSTIREVCREERLMQKADKKQAVGDRQGAEPNNKQKAQSCRILKYLLQNYTCLMIFGGRTGIQLLSMLLAYSIVGIFVFYSPFWYPSVGFASIISVTGIILQLMQQKSIKHDKNPEEQQIVNNRITIKKGLFVLVGTAAVCFYLALFGLCFKNYINSQLSLMLVNFGIVFAMDNIGIKPVLFLSIALMVGQNRLFINIIDREQQMKTNRRRVANNCERDREPETKHHIVVHLEVEPDPIDFNKSKQFSRSRVQQEKLSNTPQALPSSSIIDAVQVQHDGSVENMISRVESRKSGLNKLTSMKQLNEVQLQRIEEQPGRELQQYFCMNLRRERVEEQSRQASSKVDNILQSKSNIQTSQLVQEFILEDFICCSPKHSKQEGSISAGVHDQSKSSKYSKSKGSLRGNKTFRILERENEIELEDKQNNEESTKHEISENDIPGLPKDYSHCSHRRTDNKTHILKISGTEKEAGELEEIDINSPHRRAVRNHYETHVIPEEAVRSKRKRARRGTTKEVSQPYLLQDKLIEVYFPGRNKSDFDNLAHPKKKNFDRSQFFNQSSKKDPKGREKPIVHEIDDQHTEFFVPKF